MYRFADLLPSISVGEMSIPEQDNLRKEIENLESNDYTVTKLEKDITDNAFVKKAVDAHMKSLEYKVNKYTEMEKIVWDTKKSEKEKEKGDVNLNDEIKRIKTLVYQSLQKMKKDSEPDRIKIKRGQMLAMINDERNGLKTMAGESRRNVRLYLVKIIYMFLEMPQFFYNGFLNFMITGPAGSGKTKIAGVISNIMKNLGILGTETIVYGTKQNLVGSFIGQSGPKTRSTLSTALEGVFFLDEAYTLTPCPGQSSGDNFSQEAVGELINFMDKFVGCFVVIVAGYKGKMYDCFLEFNEGMARRFPKVIDLLPFDENDLFGIFQKVLFDSVEKTLLSEEHLNYIKSVITVLNKNDLFTNQAGDMLNLSKVIGEDALLYKGKYDKKMIQLSFRKFCASKKKYIDFN
jgi:hypothetical protein